MRIKFDNMTHHRTFASEDTAIGKVEDFLGPRLEELRNGLHWVILPVAVGPDSREHRFLPVFFAVNDEARNLAFTIANHGWPVYG